MAFTEIQQMNLRDQVVLQIRKAIIEGRLKPGDHIVESLLTSQLGVSRTPVREALILLEREGLVITYTNRGSFVRQFNPAEVAEIFSMRTNLENFAAELSVDKMNDGDFKKLDDFIRTQQEAINDDDLLSVRSIDMNFHRFLICYPRHTLLARDWEEIVAQIAALLYIRAEAIPNYNENLVISDHQSIVDAYKKRDLNAIRSANKRINERVCAECIDSVGKLSAGSFDD